VGTGGTYAKRRSDMSKEPPRERSGETVSLKGKLTLLFYLLSRDHLPAGEINKLLDMLDKTSNKVEVRYSSPAMQKLGEEFAKRVLSK
jgi:hypothetical protein